MATGQSYFSFADTETNDDNVQYLCPSIPPELPITPLATTRIDETEQYRPDKIAYRLYGDPMLSWIIDYANEFTGKDKIKGYVAGKVIDYPRLETLRTIGLLI